MCNAMQIQIFTLLYIKNLDKWEIRLANYRPWNITYSAKCVIRFLTLAHNWFYIARDWFPQLDILPHSTIHDLSELILAFSVFEIPEITRFSDFPQHWNA